jgi:hypothetical protein
MKFLIDLIIIDSILDILGTILFLFALFFIIKFLFSLLIPFMILAVMVMGVHLYYKNQQKKR